MARRLLINGLLIGGFFFPIPDAFNLIPASSTAQAANMISKNLNVSANVNVPSNCNFNGTASDLVFGDYDPAGAHAGNPKDSNTVFWFRCNKGGSAFLSLDLGDNASGTTRRMKSSTNNEYLSYNLYQDAGRSTAWSTGANALTYLPTNSSPTDFTIYGRIPEGQDVSIGTYSDTITIIAVF